MQTLTLRATLVTLLAQACALAGTARITFDTGDAIDRIDPRICAVSVEPINLNRADKF